MKKEKVLEIEFQPVWDKWAWKITKQNENVLERNNFDFIIGRKDEGEEIIKICTSEEKALIEEKVKAINEKYGIKKRWRAKNEGWYYYIHSNYSLIVFAIDHRFADDNNRYETGNYFSTEKEAKEYMEYMKKKSLEWHEKREENE